MLIRYPTSTDAYITVVTDKGTSTSTIDSPLFRYKISSKKYPIWNYSSKMYNAVASGKDIVTGMLGINFIAFTYLKAVLQLDSGDYTGGGTRDNPASGGLSFVGGKTAPMSSGVVAFSKTPSFTLDPEPVPETITSSNDNGVTLNVVVNSNIVHAKLDRSILALVNVRFMDEEMAFDAKTGEPLLQILTFIANVGRAHTFKK
jgi:hypothetical protein